MKIALVIVCTNAYFALGIRFVRRFMKFYKGSSNIQFYLFTDTDPAEYLPNLTNVSYTHITHNSWVEATNSRYKNILTLQNEDVDYIYYFDADTNIHSDFTEEWFLGDLVGLQHYGDATYMQKEGRPYDRNPLSTAYIPKDTHLPQMYYHGSFWGGTKQNILQLCQTLYNNQLKNKEISHEPCWNDESYLNQYFHYNPPSFVVFAKKFQFGVSDKGSIEETRNSKKNIEKLKTDILSRPTAVFNIQHGKVVF